MTTASPSLTLGRERDGRSFQPQLSCSGSRAKIRGPTASHANINEAPSRRGFAPRRNEGCLGYFDRGSRES